MKISPIPLFVTLLLALALLSAAGQSPEPVDLDQDMQTATLHRVGDAAPDFTCRMTDGREFRLSAKRGKLVVLYFFGKIPGACMTELGYIEKAIVQKLKSRDDFAFLAIGRQLGREEVVSMAGQKKLTLLPMAADPQEEVFQRYFLRYVPRVVVVRGDGSIAYQRSGYKEDLGLLELVNVVERELRLARLTSPSNP